MVAFKKIISLVVLLTAGLLGACDRAPRSESPPAEVTTQQADATTDSTVTRAVSVDIDEAIARFINSDGGVAIEGTDPVAYFTVGEPTVSSEEFAHEWNGVTWHFASAENRDLFIAEPEKYAPQYGGYCAWAASQGYLAEIDPTAWRIVDSRLYLNYSASIQRRWEKDIPGFIADADSQWPSVVEENL